MAVGSPPNLGTLLVQRLDAALGATLGLQTGTARAAGPQAVPQPGTPENPAALQNDSQRHPQESVDQASAGGGGRAAVGKATRETQLDNLLGRASTLSTATPSAPTTLGYAARIILALLAAYPEGAPAVRSQTPLVSNPEGLPRHDALPARLAEALNQAVRTSGLFYESHLAQFAAGKKPLKDLHHEPQGAMRIAGSAPEEPAPPARQTAPGHPGGDAPLPGRAADAASGTRGEPGAQAPVPGLDPQLQPLVRQQLEVLASQGFAWQGEPWPGARMHWEVQRDDEGDAGTRAPEDTHWATRLTLHLPALGTVHTRLNLAGPHLVMHIAAPQAAARLDGALEQLRARLLDQGLQPAQLSVTTATEPDARQSSSAHDHASD